VLYAPGTNCHEESAWVVGLAGGIGEIVGLHDLIAGDRRLDAYDGLVVPGGFSFGDHIAAGRVFAVELIARLGDELAAFAQSHPVLGICNGYQVLMETGLLPGGSVGERRGALAQNRSARYESRWSRLRADPAAGFWTEGMSSGVLRLPVAHGEGRMVLAPSVEARPAFRYVDTEDKPTEVYPWNPAASPAGLAGTVSANGMVLGLMPHPERASLRIQGSTDGLLLFQNMVNRCAESHG
jgi:phosphoribosylformylglycinamidine synthase